MTIGKSSMVQIGDTSSFMVDFPACHVGFRFWVCFVEPNGPPPKKSPQHHPEWTPIQDCPIPRMHPDEHGGDGLFFTAG